MSGDIWTWGKCPGVHLHGGVGAVLACHHILVYVFITERSTFIFRF